MQVDGPTGVVMNSAGEPLVILTDTVSWNLHSSLAATIQLTILISTSSP
ncbi:MAG: hypothetical protein ACI9BW_000724 [Gammaproteobacteria bacterium]|jgi:hypothetical protein